LIPARPSRFDEAVGAVRGGPAEKVRHAVQVSYRRVAKRANVDVRMNRTVAALFVGRAIAAIVAHRECHLTDGDE
jgi:hypothetical protein